jgi:hypothetical protein
VLSYRSRSIRRRLSSAARHRASSPVGGDADDGDALSFEQVAGSFEEARVVIDDERTK